MPTDSAAIVIACISGAVSLAVAAGAAWARHRLAAWQSDRTLELEEVRSHQTKELEELRASQARELEAYRSEQAKELETFKDALVDRREGIAKTEEAARLVARYRDPLLRSAFDFQSRIYNVYRRGGFRGGADPEYFRLNTLFVLAEFLGWLEIVRRELQFLDLGGEQTTRELGLRLQRVQDRLASTS